jgi:hypothetical protein
VRNQDFSLVTGSEATFSRCSTSIRRKALRKRKRLNLDRDMSDVIPQTQAARGGMQALNKTKIRKKNNTEGMKIETTTKKLSSIKTRTSRDLLFPKIPAVIQV